MAITLFEEIIKAEKKDLCYIQSIILQTVLSCKKNNISTMKRMYSLLKQVLIDFNSFALDSVGVLVEDIPPENIKTSIYYCLVLIASNKSINGNAVKFLDKAISISPINCKPILLLEKYKQTKDILFLNELVDVIKHNCLVVKNPEDDVVTFSKKHLVSSLLQLYKEKLTDLFEQLINYSGYMLNKNNKSIDEYMLSFAFECHNLSEINIANEIMKRLENSVDNNVKHKAISYFALKDNLHWHEFYNSFKMRLAHNELTNIDFEVIDSYINKLLQDNDSDAIETIIDYILSKPITLQSYREYYQYRFKYYQTILFYKNKDYQKVEIQTFSIINNIKKDIDNIKDEKYSNSLKKLEMQISDLQKESIIAHRKLPEKYSSQVYFKLNEKVKVLCRHTGKTSFKKYSIVKDRIDKGTYKLLS